MIFNTFSYNDKAASNHNHSGVYQPVGSYATTTELNEVKKSVSDGKSSIASAITAKGVTTAADATFSTMANNINNITTGVDGYNKSNFLKSISSYEGNYMSYSYTAIRKCMIIINSYGQNSYSGAHAGGYTYTFSTNAKELSWNTNGREGHVIHYLVMNPGDILNFNASASWGSVTNCFSSFYELYNE